MKPNQISEALFNYVGKQGRYIRRHHDTVLCERNRHAKDPLTNDQQENVSV